MEKPALKGIEENPGQVPTDGADAPEEFNHDEHMKEMEAGLQQILQSQDINQIHQIAQSLLQEEEEEEQVAGGDDSHAKMLEAVKGMMGK